MYNLLKSGAALKRLKKFIQSILGIGVIRKTLNRIMLVSLWFGSLNRLTSLVYNLVFFWQFSREQQANVKGRYLYYRNLGRPMTSRSHLRRNIHRLEKGIGMTPRRPHFAGEYIGETLEYYQSAFAQCQLDPSSIDQAELAWAHDVLSEYFRIVKAGNAKIDKARVGFEQLSKAGESGIKHPYTSDSRPDTDISYEQFLRLCERRRSVRWFLPKPVPRKMIDDALLAGRQSPSACNRLPYEFRIFDEPELVQKVVNLPMGTAGYAHNVPVVVVVIGKQESYFSPRDRHSIYTDASLAVMPFLLALETLGLASSVINWPDFEPLEIKMQKTLKLDVSERPVMLLAIGYADPKGLIPYSAKKELGTLRSYNKIQ